MFYGYGCSGPLLLILLFIGVVGYGGYGYRRGSGCVSSCTRSYKKCGGVSRRGYYSYSRGGCGGNAYGYGYNPSNRLILYIILLFLYGGFTGGLCGGFI